MRRTAFMTAITLLALVSTAFAGLPSDIISYRIMPSSPVQLSGVDPSVAKMFAAENELGAYTGWQMPNYGHYYSGMVEAVQGDEGADQVLLQFANETSYGESNNASPDIPYL